LIEKKLIFRKWLSAISTVISVIVFVPTINYLWTTLQQSGFWTLLKIIFSDSDIFLTYWQYFMHVLSESLPVFALIIFLTVITFLLWSIGNFINALKINHHKIYA
jgi:hypothetical protein